MITGKQLIEQGIITNATEDLIAQVGVDLELIKVERLFGWGFIPKKGKTKLVKYKEVDPEVIIIDVETVDHVDVPIEGIGWQLSPGAYQVTFKQGCKIPSDKVLFIRQRSSLLRNGCVLHSSVFDPGFETENIGNIIIVNQPIQIEKEARIAQVYSHNCNTVENLYDGQFQNDKQRQS